MNKSSFISSLSIFRALMAREMTVHSFKPILINAFVWTTTVITPVMFFMYKFGLPENYAQFLLPAMAVSWGFFDIVGNSTSLISDITGDKKISYELVLPVPQWIIFVKIALAAAYRAFIPGLFMLAWGQFFLYMAKGMIPIEFSFIKVVVTMATASLFYGFFGLLGAGFMQTVSDVRHLWMRILMPLWWFGGFQYNWKTIYSVAPKFAYFMLLDPIVYVMEAARGSVMGPKEFLPFWPCIGVLCVYIILFAILSINLFKKRLDCL